MRNAVPTLAIVLLVVVGVSVGATSARADLIVNGSFEDPGLGGGSWTVLDSIPGWTKVGNVTGIEIQNHAAGIPFLGEQLVELDSHDLVGSGLPTNSGMRQDVDTDNLAWYTLSFYYSPRPSRSAETNGIEVWWDGVLLETITAVGQSNTVWAEHTYTVQASDAATTALMFHATGHEDTLGGYLDNVTLNPVPEPTTLALFGLGSVGVAAVRRRRRK